MRLLPENARYLMHRGEFLVQPVGRHCARQAAAVGAGAGEGTHRCGKNTMNVFPN